MFTGIVEQQGVLAHIARKSAVARVSIRCALGNGPLALGESIAVNGVCLSVVERTSGGFEADASKETLDRTTLGNLKQGASVNLERAMRLGDRLGGHLVSGHVDGVATLVHRSKEGDAQSLGFEAPRELLRYIAPKGSVTLNGVSLTVNTVEDARFFVMIIPITASVTNMGALAIGDLVNLEVDVLARYLARLLEASTEASSGAKDADWIDRLKRAGYIQ